VVVQQQILVAFVVVLPEVVFEGRRTLDLSAFVSEEVDVFVFQNFRLFLFGYVSGETLNYLAGRHRELQVFHSHFPVH